MTGVLFLGVRAGTMMAADVLPSGGSNFETAVTLSEGNYTTDHEIAQNSYEFFKVSVASGEALSVSITTPSGEYPYAGVKMYNLGREEVGGVDIIGDATATDSVIWIPGAEDAGIFYIAVGNEYDTNALGATYAISLPSYYDAGGQADAGGTFDAAFTLPDIGTYQGYLVSYRAGTDLKDLYRLHVAAGASLSVTATPPSDESLRVAIFNSTREELVSDASANDGAILTVALSDSLTTADDLYILVEAPYSYSTKVIGYSIKVSTAVEEVGTGGGEETPTNGGSTSTGGTTGGTAAGTTNWTLIGAGVVGLVLTGILLSAFLSRKGKVGESPKPAASAPAEKASAEKEEDEEEKGEEP